MQHEHETRPCSYMYWYCLWDSWNTRRLTSASTAWGANTTQTSTRRSSKLPVSALRPFAHAHYLTTRMTFSVLAI